MRRIHLMPSPAHVETAERPPSGGETSEVMVVHRHDVSHGPVKFIGEFSIGDALDRPPSPLALSIPRLVVLRIETGSVPGDVIDFDRPPNIGEGAIGVDDGIVGKAHRMLPDEFRNAGALQCTEYPEFQS